MSDSKDYITKKQDNGTVNIRQRPDAKAPVVGQLVRERGYIPDSAKCLGVENGWYRVDYNGTTGYVKASVAYWRAKSFD